MSDVLFAVPTSVDRHMQALFDLGKEEKEESAWTRPLKNIQFSWVMQLINYRITVIEYYHYMKVP